MLVAASSPEALIASRKSGKTSGGTMMIGWRAVRNSDRHARYFVWVGSRALAVEPDIEDLRRHGLANRLAGLLLTGSLQRTTGLGQEHVVEAGSVELEVGDLDPLAVETADDFGELLGAVGQPDGGSAARRGQRVAEPRQHGLQALDLRCVRRDGLHTRTADRGLELGRGALRHELAPIDDPNPVCERVGLLEVLGGQEYGHALGPREARDLVPQRLPALDVEARGRPVPGQDCGP